MIERSARRMEPALIVNIAAVATRDAHRAEVVFDGVVPARDVDGDVLVYRQRATWWFAYVGVLRDARLDRASGRLSGTFEPFDREVVAADGPRGLLRRDLVESPNGFGREQFNYVTRRAVASVLAEACGTPPRIELRSVG